MYVHMCLCHIYTCSTHTHPFTFENPKWLTAYHLPLAAVTNYHEVSSLKATQIDCLMVLEVRCLQWLSLGRNWGVGMPSFRSASLRRGSTFYLSQLLEDPCILWFLGPFYLQSQQWPASPSFLMMPSPWIWLLFCFSFLHLKALVVTLEPCR